MKQPNSLPCCSKFASDRRPSALRRWLVAVAVCLILPGVQASPLFQDSFDYTLGTVLAGNGTWVNSATHIRVGTTNLSYPGLPDVSPVGHAANILGQSASTMEYTYTPFSPAVTSGDVYASFILDFSYAGGNYTFLGMLPSAGNGGNFTSANDPIDLSSIAITGGYQLGIRALNKSASYTGMPVLPLNTPELIVIKYDFSSHQASLFINPTLDGNEPASATQVSTGTTSAADLGRFYLRIGGANQGNYYVDDVRVGTSWVEVIPEPAAASLMLMAFGLLGLAFRHRGAAKD